MALPKSHLLESSSNHFSLDRFFEISRDILCIAGYDGYLKKVNAAFSNILGYSTEELMDKPIDNFIYEGDKHITAHLREKLIQDVPLLNFENRYLTKKGEIVWLSWTSIPDPDSRTIYAIAKDVTHIKNLEKERNSLLSNLTRVNTELKQLTYALSHDLRAPVNNLLSLFELVEINKIEDFETRQYIELAETSSVNLKKTLNKYMDVLTEKDKLNIKLESVNIKDTLKHILYSIRTLVKNSNARLETDFSEFEEVKFNSAYLHSIFLNLLSNSIKYSRAGVNPVISITAKKEDNLKRLIFSDNGKGLNMKKVQNKIFGLNQQFHDHKDSRGIGLYLVYNHMQSLGGTITVDSKENIGTTFILSFRE